MDGVLLNVIDAETQVHEEFLRLILATSPSLSGPQIALYLQTALERTKKSRRKFKRKFEEEVMLELGPQGLLNASQAGYSSGGGFTSGFRPSALAMLETAGLGSGEDEAGGGSSPAAILLRSRMRQGDDGVRNTYKLIREKLSTRLTAEMAPALFSYLSGQAL